jgi:hypothetical protein
MAQVLPKIVNLLDFNAQCVCQRLHGIELFDDPLDRSFNIRFGLAQLVQVGQKLNFGSVTITSVKTVVLKPREILFVVLIDVFIGLTISEKNCVLLIFAICVEKRDKSIVLCYSAVRNTDLQI